MSTDNAGFVRPGATLGIVSVSDAEDQSPQTVSFYVNQLLNVKPPGRVTFSAIAPLQATSPIAGCTYDGGRRRATDPRRRHRARRLVAGDLHARLEAGPARPGPQRLRSVFGADLTAGRNITVKVSATAVPSTAGGGATVWSYDVTANRLIFEPAYVPAPGDAVTATYFVACIP